MGRLNWDKCYWDKARPEYDEDERERRMVASCQGYLETMERRAERRRRRKEDESSLSVRDQIRKEIRERGPLDNIKD